MIFKWCSSLPNVNTLEVTNVLICTSSLISFGTALQSFYMHSINIFKCMSDIALKVKTTALHQPSGDSDPCNGLCLSEVHMYTMHFCSLIKAWILSQCQARVRSPRALSGSDSHLNFVIICRRIWEPMTGPCVITFYYR